MPEYTIASAVAVVAVVLAERFAIRSGVFRRPAYWVSLIIVAGFQVPVDGWLTKLSAPIVTYAPEHATGIRFPWDIPIEDFLFGFAMVTLTLALWDRRSARDERESGPRQGTSRRRKPAPGA